MDRIVWCIKAKNGIERIEPNQNLAQGYIKKAEESLETAQLARSRDWKISAAYYTLYFSLYSLLMRLGIKCEIHSCTIACAQQFLTGKLTPEQLDLLDSGFRARNDAQYYVNKDVPDDDYDALMRKAPSFLAACKNITFSEREIKDIREKVREKE
jgi:uncharacterized protein (UPF0332 family)